MSELTIESLGLSKGESKSEAGGYSWSARQTRITHLVHEHLQHEISVAMKDAIKAANSKIAEGIQETVKIKLAEITKSLKVQTKI